jgi:mono/diheme cytochrome c family protein
LLGRDPVLVELQVQLTVAVDDRGVAAAAAASDGGHARENSDQPPHGGINMMPAAMSRRFLIVAALAATAGLSACGSQGNDVSDNATIERGSQLFAERCSGCHTMKIVGAEGGATEVHDRERVDGPNFNTRKESVDTVLFAIRNGGYSGAIMPENIVVGDDAQAVAEFLAKYAGHGPAK